MEQGTTKPNVATKAFCLAFTIALNVVLLSLYFEPLLLPCLQSCRQSCQTANDASTAAHKSQNVQTRVVLETTGNQVSAQPNFKIFAIYPGDKKIHVSDLIGKSPQIDQRSTNLSNDSLSVSHGRRFKVKYTYVDVPAGLCVKLATKLGQNFQYAFIDGSPVMNQMTHTIDAAAVSADCSSASTETLTFASN